MSYIFSLATAIFGVLTNSQIINTITSWNYGDPQMPYSTEAGVCGYNSITDEFVIFGGCNGKDGCSQNFTYKYSYQTGIWTKINFIPKIGSYSSQYYTQYNHVIYYYNDDKINTFNMTYPYSTTLEINIPVYDITIYKSPCLSVDIYGNLYLSSGGFALFGHVLNFYGYIVNDGEWKAFSHSSYWDTYNYDMRTMACIVHKQILYTFGGAAGFDQYVSEYYGSNMISYHNISDYNTPYLVQGFSRWNKVPQNLTQFGTNMRVVSIEKLIYIIGGNSHYSNADGTCCVDAFNDVQIFDPSTHTIIGKMDGVEPLPTPKWWSTHCHYRPISHQIYCFGGKQRDESATNSWVYSNSLLTNLTSESPSQSPSQSPTQTPSQLPSQLPSKSPTQTPTESRSQLPSNIPTTIPTDTLTKTNKNMANNDITIKTIIIIVAMILAVIFILCLILLYVLINRVYGSKAETDTEVNSPSHTIKAIQLASFSADNPVILKSIETSKNIEPNIPHNINSIKPNDSDIDMYINNFKSTIHGNTIKPIISTKETNGGVISEFENEYKNDGMNHKQTIVSIQIEGSLNTKTINV